MSCVVGSGNQRTTVTAMQLPRHKLQVVLARATWKGAGASSQLPRSMQLPRYLPTSCLKIVLVSNQGVSPFNSVIANFNIDQSELWKGKLERNLPQSLSPVLFRRQR